MQLIFLVFWDVTLRPWVNGPRLFEKTQFPNLKVPISLSGNLRTQLRIQLGKNPLHLLLCINAEVFKANAKLCQSDVRRPRYADVVPMYEVAVMLLDLGCFVRESPLFYFFPVP